MVNNNELIFEVVNVSLQKDGQDGFIETKEESMVFMHDMSGGGDTCRASRSSIRAPMKYSIFLLISVK